jgi:hypothetical protein
MHEAIRDAPVGGKKLVTIGDPAAMRLGATSIQLSCEKEVTMRRERALRSLWC